MTVRKAHDPDPPMLPDERRNAEGRRSIVRTALSVGLAVMLATLIVTAALGVAFGSGARMSRMTFDFGGGIAPCLAGRC